MYYILYSVMKLTSTMVIKMDRNKNIIRRDFVSKTIKTINICSDGFGLPLDNLNITLNDKEIKLVNSFEGLHLGSINYNITQNDYEINIYNSIDVLNIEYNYIDFNKENDIIKEQVKNFPKTYNSDCYVVITYYIDDKYDNGFLKLKNTLNKEL